MGQSEVIANHHVIPSPYIQTVTVPTVTLYKSKRKTGGQDKLKQTHQIWKLN
jgi:hypothetical protein